MLALVCYAVILLNSIKNVSLVKSDVFRNKENIFNSWLLVTHEKEICGS